MAAGVKNREMRGKQGFFRREVSLSDQKLLELIYALLTTTGCGHCPVQPQPIELWF
jgi:hypothetical protein